MSPQSPLPSCHVSIHDKEGIGVCHADVQMWAKEWSLGCVKRAPGNAGITQTREPFISRSLYVGRTLIPRGAYTPPAQITTAAGAVCAQNRIYNPVAVAGPLFSSGFPSRIWEGMK